MIIICNNNNNALFKAKSIKRNIGLPYNNQTTQVSCLQLGIKNNRYMFYNV